MLAHAFPKEPPPSLAHAHARVSALSGVEPTLFDCCVNSCCCYVGPYINDQHCTFCNKPRLDSRGRPRSQFTYVPLLPRLVALYHNPRMAEQMRYRASCEYEPDWVNDIFDGHIYCNLCHTKIEVDGQQLPSNYFSDPHDIALGLSTDGFAPFQRQKTTAWPIIIYNFNLPPDIRFHHQYILCLGVVPGPKKPKDFDSFLWPAVEEFLTLVLGTRAYDALVHKLFLLCAHLILIGGDIPAISMVMRMKGHNGLSPCRMCKIKGLRIPNSRATTHYVPLDRQRHPDVVNAPADTTVAKYDPADLPLRQHDEILEMGRQVQHASTNAEAERLAKEYGVKGVPVLSFIRSVQFPWSFPFDFMHLIFENLVPNLIQLWTHDFKDLGSADNPFVIRPTVWQAVGAATASCGPTIPYSFCSHPQNIATDKSQCTADAWSFWLQYIAPVILENRFTEDKYYWHFVDLVKLVRTYMPSV